MVLYCVAVSHAAGNPVEMKVLSEEQRASAEYKNINMTGKFPLLQTPEGCINESIAIAKYLAHGHATLLGKDEWERAKVDQWCQWQICNVMPDLMPVCRAIFGWSTETTQTEFMDAQKKLKEHLKTISSALTGKFICGDEITVADFILAGPLALAFQTIFDAGFCKAPIN